MKRIHVAAAVIRGPESSVLIAKRPLDKHQGGLWEFPGGKVEDGEGVESALALRLGGGQKARESAALLFAAWQGQSLWSKTGEQTVRLKDAVKRLT